MEYLEFWVWDARYHSDNDRAVVLATEPTLGDARAIASLLSEQFGDVVITGVREDDGGLDVMESEER